MAKSKPEITVSRHTVIDVVAKHYANELEFTTSKNLVCWSSLYFII